MADREQFAPRPAIGAQTPQAEESWTIILTREPCHSPESIWRALTDPSDLCDWASLDTGAIFGAAGPEDSAKREAPPLHSALGSVYG